jgi:hypothetical protein
MLECKKTAQRTKELIDDRDLTVTFGKMKTSHYDGWDESVSRYLQAVRSSCRGGCGDVFIAKLQHGETEVTMHHYYPKVGVEMMQEDGALEKKERLKKHKFVVLQEVYSHLLVLGPIGFYKTCTESAIISPTPMY